MAEESEKRFVAIMDKLFQTPPKSKPRVLSTSDSGVGGKKRVNPWSDLRDVEPRSRSNLAEELQNQSGTAKASQTPACRPWDRGDFFRRLATFKSMTWFAKPEAVNAINCARRGWVNVDFDTIECEACGARILISTPQSWTHEQVEKTALVFSLKLDSGHKLLCPWVNNICDELLTRFPPAQSAVLVDDYKTRYAALFQLSALPVISSSSIAHMTSPELEHFLKEHSTGEDAESLQTSGPDNLGNELEPVPPISYYQAQKLISLCGWEPHPLPYTVGLKERHDQFIKHGNLSEIHHGVSSGKNCSISAFSSSTDGSTDSYDADVASAELQFDPKSVVLDCGLCGAKVGLWAFSSMPRPVELLRLVGHMEVNDKSDLDADEEQGPRNKSSSNGRPVALTDITTSPKSLDEGLKLNLTIAGGPPPTKQNYRAIISLPVVGRNLRARFSSGASVEDYVNVSNSSKVLEDQDIVVVGENTTTEGTSESKASSLPENPLASTRIVVQDPCDTERLPGNGSCTTHDIGEGSDSQVDIDSRSTRGDDVANVNGPNNEDSTGIHAEAQCHVPCNSLENRQVEPNLPLVHHKSAHSGADNDLQVRPSEKAMEFDPIRQHRSFCPWITSSGNSVPGWQQTLSALQRHKVFSHPSPEKPSSSLVEVKNPIASIRELFSPPSKRSKLAHRS